ncbi:hypothetical protein [Stenotrophomonas sp.]|uniref:hypothetical protein n=1 Tax=Stenotrophomonas sp. TaxID=69392 RepID=UPI0028A6484D|nr:hypothetical protein [Stenotrophomonas sp.]
MDENEVSFALVTEGITDQVTLEAILKGHYKRFDGDIDVVVNSIQPIRDATDASRQGDFGGWERVFEACARPEVSDNALTFNQYLIVQIDTDMGDHPNFGLPLAPGGVDVDETTLVAQARALIATKFGDKWPHIENRVFTAVSVHSLECWLMALHALAENRSTRRCDERLRQELARQNKAYDKNHACYAEISKDFRKTRLLDSARARCVSLDHFVSDLPPPVEA